MDNTNQTDRNTIGKFIYVFTKTTADMLSSLGYRLLHFDPDNAIYLFENNECLCFDLNECDEDEVLFSNTLTF